jgi:hypothetical protein
MSFCTTCGRPCGGSVQFCTGCGARFADEPPAAKDTPTEPLAADQTRWDQVPVPEPTVWSQPPVPPGPPSPLATSGVRQGRGAVFIAATVVGLIAVAGAAFGLTTVLTGHGHNKSHVTAAASVRATRSAAARPSPAPSATPSATLSSTPAATASPGSSTVTMAASAVGDPDVTQVTAVLSRYFTGINKHDYSLYSSALDQQMQQQNTASSFASGYQTTTDSAETLTGVSDSGGGDLTATVTFTSHQQPSDSPDNSPCTDWEITLFLLPQGTGYLIGPPPSSYRASYQAC